MTDANNVDKTIIKLAEEYADKHECGDQAWGGAYDGFIAGYKAGYDRGAKRGAEVTHLVYDAIREHLEKELFPVVQHEPPEDV